jgi:hypothetical protein
MVSKLRGGRFDLAISSLLRCFTPNGLAGYGYRSARGLDDCPSLEACLQLIDQVVPARDDGEGSNSTVLATRASP